jgi:hypothetical protein
MKKIVIKFRPTLKRNLMHFEVQRNNRMQIVSMKTIYYRPRVKRMIERDLRGE